MISRTVPEILADVAAIDPDGIAIIEDGKKISYLRLMRMAEAGAAVLNAHKLKHGDRVALWGPNTADWIVAALAIHLNGAILVPLNTRLKLAEAADIVIRTNARIVLTTEHFLNSDNVSGLRSDERLKKVSVISLDGNGPDAWRAFMANVLDREVTSSQLSSARPEDLSDFIYTSGTTGLPKGVATTHAQTTTNARAWGEAVGLTSDDTYLIVNPFFHTFGYKAGWLASLWFRTTILPVPTFNAAEACRLIEAHRVTILPGPPTLFEDLLRFKDRHKYDLSSLRAATTGAAVVPEELVRRMQSDLGIDQVMTAYGLTESCGVATITGRSDTIDRISTSCGKPLEGVEVLIANEEGIPVETGETGEVLLRSEYNFVYYVDDPEATKASYNPNGWMKTGDLGRLDSHGYLSITGRKKDMFICGGFNCYPAEIEFQLRQHPDVIDAAIIGIPDERLGEVGAGFITVEDNSSLRTEDFLEWARDMIANYKIPRQVQIVDSLPRNSLGKVEKHKLYALLETTKRTV